MTYPAITRPTPLLRLAAMAGAAVAILAQPSLADTYTLDKDHTEVRFSWNHLGLSKQSGRFLDVSGTVEFDPAEPEATYADIAIKLNSVQTGVVALDRALTGKEFFDLGVSPAATFKSTKVIRTGGKTARMTGDLTFNGVTNPVTLDVTWNFTGEHPMAPINPAFLGVYASGFSATTQLRRSDWGLTRTIPYVSDEIEIFIETEMHRKGGAPAEASQIRPSAADGVGETPPPQSSDALGRVRELLE